MYKFKKAVALAIVTIASVFGLMVAKATSVTWQFSSVFFFPSDGGGALTGAFVFDTTTHTITEWNISVEGGVVFPQQIPPYNYTSSSPEASASYRLTAPGEVLIRFGTTPLPDLSSGLGPCDSTQPQRCLILWTTPLPESGGEVSIESGQETFTPAPFNSFIRSIDPSKNPQLTSPSVVFSATPNVLWPPNHQMIPVTVAVPQARLSNCQISSVSSNELITKSDWEITGDLTVNLRAARLGTGQGRIYTIALSCTDNSGNNVTGNTTVTVPKAQ